MLTFLGALASARYLITRQGFFWIIPVIISGILSYQNLITLLVAAESSSDVLTFAAIIPLVLSILWYAMIQAFHYALKTQRSYNKYVEESRRTYNESRFVEKFERRMTVKEFQEKREELRNKPVSPKVSPYHFPTDLDD